MIKRKNSLANELLVSLCLKYDFCRSLISINLFYRVLKKLKSDRTFMVEWKGIFTNKN